MEKLIVQTLLPEPYVSWRNTDYATGKDFTVLGEAMNIEFRMAEQLGVVAPLNAWALVEAACVRIPFGTALRMSRPWLRLRRWVRVERGLTSGAQLLYTNFALPGNATLPLPLVLEADFYPYGSTAEQREHTRLILTLPERAIEQAAAVILRCEASREAFAKLYPKHVHKTSVIGWYMPYLEPVADETLRTKWAAPEPPRLLFTGQQSRRKGLVPLLEAASRLRARGHAFHLTVVTNFYDGKVAIPPWVELLSNIPRSAVQDLMAHAHFFVLPTFCDAHPKVFTEALAAGTVLLAPSHEPMAQIFGAYGVTANPHSVDDVTAALERLVSAPASYARLAAQNRSVFCERFHHSVVGQAYAAVFRNAVAGTVARPQ